MNARKIGKRLRKMRGKRTQKQIAKALGISDSALSMYEQGERIPKDDIKKRIADYYHCTVGEIFFT